MKTKKDKKQLSQIFTINLLLDACYIFFTRGIYKNFLALRELHKFQVDLSIRSARKIFSNTSVTHLTW